MVVSETKVVVHPGEVRRVRLWCRQCDDAVLVRVRRDFSLGDRCPLGGHLWRSEVDVESVERLVKSLADLGKQEAVYIQLEIDAPERYA